jgi:hypothetical protein
MRCKDDDFAGLSETCFRCRLWGARFQWQWGSCKISAKMAAMRKTVKISSVDERERLAR